MNKFIKIAILFAFCFSFSYADIEAQKREQLNKAINTLKEQTGTGNTQKPSIDVRNPLGNNREKATFPEEEEILIEDALNETAQQEDTPMTSLPDPSNTVDGQKLYTPAPVGTPANPEGEEKPSLFSPTKPKRAASSGKDYSNAEIPPNAKLATLRTEMNFMIVKNKFSVIEFPFEITEIEFGEFVRRKDKANENNATTYDNYSYQEEERIDITQKENKLLINSKYAGRFEAIIWGGGYPVNVKININNYEGNAYYAVRERTFKGTDKTKSAKIENNPHERIITILSTALYRDAVPKGYEKVSTKKTFNYKDIDIKLVRSYTLYGEKYQAEKWDIINTHKKKALRLYEESFYKEDVYSVSFLSNEVSPKKSTSMYIVRKRLPKGAE